MNADFAAVACEMLQSDDAFFFTIANPISLMMWLPAVPSSAVLGVMNNTVTVAER